VIVGEPPKLRLSRLRLGFLGRNGAPIRAGSFLVGDGLDLGPR